ncbi:MAG: hypothetical protein A3G33_09485 [Omnitrophica bacterium RIFCSPLOWO2_12_FULL_44_17]|uniref:Uncharacterized protein n=1 Tax=Candidatus Danuiimicrobium aquiferis TaxID=1801832 RepID=A0A1G1KWW7_9BACT|nr:MAG: hypothetical protein A3B72_09875 [Omnitrophica bacterium RIFCSPHIGHO2_02_FULL_45_28]OGW89608.1 MAG: hypothetical protein A3E74_04935 [Omnitrophica bacterium RIFCSPHIGHO2_12_FULL_44_12]OGW97413.1 MAG: hypothetical protein A3G33_09485 [Omnitrophica bacterium RIFCSPLOWO2_12_FULL_44_17]OGX04487.1 MAG: hypothetical protein A3J12_10525 [Omnitrophica bacterium RIFCSPLOWO2_02_FULL_44_11]
MSEESHLCTDSEKLKESISKVIQPDKELKTLPPLFGQPKRILLIVPPGTPEESYGRLSAAAGELPMLGLAYIAASLREQGNLVKVIDCEIHGWPISKISEDIRSFSPDIIGMTAYITNMKRCAAVARVAKEINPRITVILGGPQVSTAPEEGFHSPDVDIIVISEGEIVIRNVINALGDDHQLKQVKGIWFRDRSGHVIQNEQEGLVADIDLFPPPALDLYEMDLYFPPVHIRGEKVAHLMTSRGCPFQCTFCETKLTFGRSIRYHSIERVLRDLVGLIRQGYKSFQFYDDIFTLNPKRTEELCCRIIEKGWKIEWICFTRTNCVNDDLLSVMKRAGCYLIVYGCESGDNELLKLIKKGLTIEQNLEALWLAKKHGILTLASFMLGLPTETYDQSLKTIQFALNPCLDYAAFPICEPYPGTELWIDAVKYGTFDTSGRYRNNLLSENAAVWIPHGRTRKELEQLSIYAMKRFYFRPRIIWQGFKNFFHLPIKRATNYFIAGFKYFFFSESDSSVPGTRF